MRWIVTQRKWKLFDAVFTVYLVSFACCFTGKQVAPHSDPGLTTPPGFDVITMLSTLHQQFTFVRLLDSYLTESRSAFSLTLTTRALYTCSLRWFGAYSCQSAPRGPPSSHGQHRISQYSHDPLLIRRPRSRKNALVAQCHLYQH